MSKGVKDLEELRIYSVSDEYIEYLRKQDSNVYSNKPKNRTHTRKYIGVVIEMAGYKYYIPLSSPKNTDYQVAGIGKVIKKSIVPIIRIVVKNTKGEKELKGTLRISHMIPVPESELMLYELDDEIDEEYKDLVQNEIIFIRKNAKKIKENANLIYKQKKTGDINIGYVKYALDYAMLEELCDEFINLYAKESDKKATTVALLSEEK